MKATLEKVDNGFILETKDGKRVEKTLNDILPTIYDMCQKEIRDCAEGVGQMCWKFKIEINVTPTTKQESDCEVKEVPCKEEKDNPIGEVIEYKGKHLLCTEVEGETCYGCYFANKDCEQMGLPPCNGKKRKDGKNVIFVKEKKEL